MLLLHEEQINVLNEHAQRMFEGRVAQYLREPHDDLPALPRFDALALAQHTVAMADAYGLEHEDDIIALADVYRRLGWGFEEQEEHEDILGILRAPSVAGYAKIAALHEHIATVGESSS